MSKKEQKKKQNSNRHKFLNKRFFPDAKGYAVKTLDDFVLVRQWNGNTNRWEVAIWDAETYGRVRNMYQEDLF